MSVVVPTVGDMETTTGPSTRTHICIYFDDGGPELLCSCGCRAVLLVDDEGYDSALYAMLEEEAAAHAQPRSSSA